MPSRQGHHLGCASRIGTDGGLMSWIKTHQPLETAPRKASP